MMGRPILSYWIVRRNGKRGISHSKRLRGKHRLRNRMRMHKVTHPNVDKRAAECNDNARDEGSYDFN